MLDVLLSACGFGNLRYSIKNRPRIGRVIGFKQRRELLRLDQRVGYRIPRIEQILLRSHPSVVTPWKC